MAPGLISVETLDYPLGILKDLIDAFGLGVCLDVGHLILHGRDVEKTFADFKAKPPSFISTGSGTARTTWRSITCRTTWKQR